MDDERELRFALAPVHVEIIWDAGTLVVPTLPTLPPEAASAGSLLTLDPRTGVYRAPAHAYRGLLLGLHRAKVPFVDQARAFEPLSLRLARPIQPFPYQAEALEAWLGRGSRGVVELPTGAGKTILAVLAIERTQRPTLVVVPTIELLLQWQRVLSENLGVEVGMIGGGAHERRPITVTTYDSAALHMEHLGRHFGLLVCDECHHLPAPAYRFIAEGALAPFRLGLSATLERADGGERLVFELLGPLVHRVGIEALEGEYLAPYEVRSIPVSLTDDEQARYDAARQLYLNFLRECGVSLKQKDGWAKFISRAHQSGEGRKAYQAYREQKRIALTGSAKLEALWKILLDHHEDRVLVFADENETVYGLSRLFLAPAITHHTKTPERKRLLGAFARGESRVLFTAKVLNEGVDVPEANVGVVLSGSGSVREHVQRLGRILRKRPGKRALLYEIFTEVAAELSISERRRQHRAYQKGEGG